MADVPSHALLCEQCDCARFELISDRQPPASWLVARCIACGHGVQIMFADGMMRTRALGRVGLHEVQ